MKPSILVCVVLLSACSGGEEARPTPPQAPETKPAGLADAAAPGSPKSPEPPPERVLTEAEFALLKDDLSDLRQGVRPFTEESLGVCVRKDKSCGSFVGATAEELAEGDYLLWAELRAPRLGPEDGWPVSLETRCTLETSGGSRTSEQTRTYTVRYAGEERGFRLRLREFSSPGKGGATRCSWSLRSDLEDGRVVGEGAWSMPAEGA